MGACALQNQRFFNGSGRTALASSEPIAVLTEQRAVAAAITNGAYNISMLMKGNIFALAARN